MTFFRDIDKRVDSITIECNKLAKKKMAKTQKKKIKNKIHPCKKDTIY